MRRSSPLRRARGASGFGLLELLIAMTVGALVIAGLGRGLSSALSATRSGRTTVQASLLAAERLEEIRGIGWGDGLAHLTGSLSGAVEVVGGRYDPDGTGPLAPEDVVTNAVGELTTYTRTTTDRGITFTTSIFITDAGSAKRATATVAWREGTRDFSTRLGTLIAPLPTTIIGGTALKPGKAAAYVIAGAVPPGGTLAAVGLVQAPPDATASVGPFSPAPQITGTAAATLARASGGTNRGLTTIDALTITLAGLTVTGTSIAAEVISTSPGVTPTMTGTGSVTLNGTTYVNPTPNTLVTIGLWRIILNSQRAEADGSRTVTYILITGPATELTAGYAWARPV